MTSPQVLVTVTHSD